MKKVTGNSCKNLSTIQRSDQDLWTFWASFLVWSVVWLDEMSTAWSRVILSMQGKTLFANSCKNLWTIQRAYLELWNFWSVLFCGRCFGSTRRRRHRVAISLRLQNKQPLVKNWARPMVRSRVMDLLSHTLVGSVVWPYQTLLGSSSDFIVTARKTASTNSCKNLSTMIGT